MLGEASLRVGLVGCGNIAARHAQVLTELPETTLAAVVDVDPARARAFAERFGARVVADVKTLARRDEIDAVVLALPADRHAEAGLICVEADKAVLSEKPIDTDPARAAALARAADEHGVTLSVVSQNRFFDDVLWLRDLLVRRVLGRPLLIDVATLWRRDQAYYDGAPGRGRHVRAEGGVLLNQGVHCVDLMLWLFGAALSVASHAATLTHQIAVEDALSLSIAFASGALGTLLASTSTLAEPERLEVRCERGTVVISGGTAVRVECEPGIALPPRPSAAGAAVASDKLEPFRRQHRDFAAAVRAGRAPTVTSQQARAVLDLILAAYRSSELGQRVALG